MESATITAFYRNITKDENKKDGYRQLNVRQLGSLRPWDNRGKCYINRKRIQCLSKVSQHVPIYLQSFPSNSSRKIQGRHFSTFFAHFGLPVYAPGTIAVNVTRLERGFNACKTPRCIYPSIFNRFPVIQAGSLKIRNFSTFFAHFGLPCVRPSDNRGKCIALNPLSNSVTAIVPGATPYGGVKCKGVGKSCDFRPISRYSS